jgi:predicted DCC family thiol-disulfide oxidoreductase YuxK
MVVMPHNRALSQHVLIYDGDCAFCTLWVNRLEKWLPSFPSTKTSQSISLDDYALSADDVAHFAWYITPSHHYAGHLAASALLRAQPSGWLRFLGWLIATPPLSYLAAGVYAAVAKFRGSLPGGTPTCDTSGSR